jgi:twitching motility protein PilT
MTRFFSNEISVLDSLRPWPERGLLVLSGPPFSGKTTTAHQLLNRINAGCRRHIATLEDPVERRLKPRKSMVEQYQMGLDVAGAEEAFHIFRQEDVDVVYLNGFRSGLDRLLVPVLEMASGNCLVIWELESHTEEDLFQDKFKLSSSRAMLSLRYHLADVLAGILTHNLYLPSRLNIRPDHNFLPADPVAKACLRDARFEVLQQMIRKVNTVTK